MKFVKTFYSVGNPRDPRSTLYAEFICENCNEESWIEIKEPSKFDYSRERKCPECGVISKSNQKEVLMNKRLELEQEQNRIKQEIDKIIKELEKIEITS